MINHINLLIKQVIYNKVYDYKKSKKSSQKSNWEMVLGRAGIFLALPMPFLLIYCAPNVYTCHPHRTSLKPPDTGETVE